MAATTDHYSGETLRQFAARARITAESYGAAPHNLEDGMNNPGYGGGIGGVCLVVLRRGDHEVILTTPPVPTTYARVGSSALFEAVIEAVKVNRHNQMTIEPLSERLKELLDNDEGLIKRLSRHIALV